MMTPMVYAVTVTDPSHCDGQSPSGTRPAWHRDGVTGGETLTVRRAPHHHDEDDSDGRDRRCPQSRFPCRAAQFYENS